MIVHIIIIASFDPLAAPNQPSPAKQTSLHHHHHPCYDHIEPDHDHRHHDHLDRDPHHRDHPQDNLTIFNEDFIAGWLLSQ